MTDSTLYRRHLDVLDRYLADALARAGRGGLALDGVLFHAGRMGYYHRDDQPFAFRPAPHFVRYVPLAGPEHCVLAQPGQRPRVIRVAPRDFWEELAPPPASYWQSEVDLVEVPSFDAVKGALGVETGRLAYVGNSAEAAGALGIDADRVEPAALLAPLDWYRAYKTDHEIALMTVAARRAADGHRVARKAFESGANELEIHWAYLQATGHVEKDVPFETIVSFDEKTATLHYNGKRTEIPTRRHTFMLDAGAVYDGYASDITRTWVARDADPVFRALLDGVDAFQRDLVALCTAGRPFLDVHVEAHRRTARLLAETKIVRDAEAAFEQGVTRTFLPHGLGHHLGIQVHDIGGRQQGPDGGSVPPPPEYPFLRNTRTLEPGHVVTVEPGLYFIPMLLDQLKAGPAGALLDWALVARLTPLGGIRIEDDVLVTGSGPRDLTRGLIQGPRGV